MANTAAVTVIPIHIPDAIQDLAPNLIGCLEDETMVVFLAAFCTRYIKALEGLAAAYEVTQNNLMLVRVVAFIETESKFRTMGIREGTLGAFAERWEVEQQLAIDAQLALHSQSQDLLGDFKKLKASLPKKQRKEPAE